MKKYLLTFTALITVSTAYALDCSISARPSCEDLGYTKSAADCEGKETLRCFFDPEYVFCGPRTCEDDGYFSTAQDGYICATITSNGNTCYDCQGSTCGTGVVSDGETLVYDSSGSAIAIAYNGNYYSPKAFSCGGRTYATSVQNISDNPQYIMPPYTLNSAIQSIINVTSYWTTTQCGSTSHITGTGSCTSDDTSLSCTVGLQNCADSCPTGYQFSSCTSSQAQASTATSTSGLTCYKCLADTCPSSQYKSCGSFTVTATGSTTAAGSQCYTCECQTGYFRTRTSNNYCSSCTPACTVEDVKTTAQYLNYYSGKSVGAVYSDIGYDPVTYCTSRGHLYGFQLPLCDDSSTTCYVCDIE